MVVRLPDGSASSHRLYHGAHRFYCSVAAGYSHVPAIEVAGSYQAAFRSSENPCTLSVQPSAVPLGDAIPDNSLEIIDRLGSRLR